MTYLDQRLALTILAWASYAASQAPNPVDIDDFYMYSANTPTGIQYSSRFGPNDWSSVTTGDPNQRFRGTYTQTQTWRSQLWFSFRGQSIAYYADKPPGSGVFVLSIDGGSNINVTWTNSGTTMQYRQRLWSSDGILDQGDHSLVIGNINQNNEPIGLDGLAVTPWSGTDITPQRLGPGASSVPAGAVLADSEDNAVIYPNSWDKYFTEANSKNQNMYFNDTERCSKTPGSFATFQFNGTALWCFANNYSGSAPIKLSINGVPEQTVNAAIAGDTWSTQWMFCNITGLIAQPHTVTLTHMGANGDLACIDFFMYMPSSASSATLTATSTPTSTSAPTTDPNTNSVPVGAIAGGVVGGVVFLALLIALTYILHQRRQSRQPTYNTHHESYTGAAAYQTKQVSPVNTPNDLGPVSTVYQRPHSPYSNLGGSASVVPTAWTGATYTGHPEL